MEIQTVLLVDDDPHIRKLAKMSLERVGHWIVAVASSGQEALDLLQNQLPDVVVLDVMMPGLCGEATLREIKSNPRLASLPVILMTAKVQSQEVDEYLLLGAAGIIIKPFDPLKLPDEIRNIVKNL